MTLAAVNPSNALANLHVDADGNLLTTGTGGGGGGGGTQYTHGQAVGTPTSTAAGWWDGTQLWTVSTTHPMPVSGALTLSGTDDIGYSAYRAAILKLVPAVSTSPAYTAGDVVGGKQTITNAMRITSGSARLKSVSLEVSTAATTPALTILFFDADFTCPADNAAWAWTAADRAKFVGAVSVLTTDWVTLGGESVATIPGADLLLAANGSSTLYAAIITSSTPTFGSTTALRLAIAVEQN